MQSFESDEWQIEIDIEINNKQRNAWSFGFFNLYFMPYKSPDATSAMYGSGLIRAPVGLSINLMENLGSAPENPVYENSRQIIGHKVKANYVAAEDMYPS